MIREYQSRNYLIGQLSPEVRHVIPIPILFTPKLTTHIDATPANYWSAEILYSPSFKFLWATARAQSNTNLTGFINIYSLDPTTGRIVEKVAMAETTTKGGIANAIAPAEFSDEFAALADVPSRYVEIWRWEGGSDSGGKVLKAVAKVDINDGGCCANAIWYD